MEKYKNFAPETLKKTAWYLLMGNKDILKLIDNSEPKRIKNYLFFNNIFGNNIILPSKYMWLIKIKILCWI